jgi:hypothetical protein
MSVGPRTSCGHGRELEQQKPMYPLIAGALGLTDGVVEALAVVRLGLGTRNAISA